MSYYNIFRISYRYFNSRKSDKFVSFISGFSLIGVAIGVAALIIVMSIMRGVYIELSENIKGVNSDVTLYNLEDESKLRNISFNKISIGQGLVSSINTNQGIVIRGLNEDAFKFKKKIHILAGTYSLQKDSALIGSELARNLNVWVGDMIKIITPSNIESIIGSLPRVKSFKVSGIYSADNYEYDAGTVIINLEVAEIFFGTSKVYEVYTDQDPNKFCLDTKLDCLCQTWMDKNHHIYKALQVERVAMFVILSLIIIVAAFNIISSLFMLVKDKTKDIAVMRGFGASKSDIIKIFMLTGSFIGFFGVLIGTIFGVIVSVNIDNIRIFLERFLDFPLFPKEIYFFLSKLPSKLMLEDIILTILFALLMTLISTIYPALKASSILPAQGLRYE